MESFTGAAKNELKLGERWNCWCQNLIRVVYQEGIEVLADTQIVAIAILILRYGCSGQIETLQGFHCTTHLQHYDLERKKNKSRHQDKKDFNDLDVLLTSPGPLWLMMSIGAFGHFFAYTLSIYLLNVCLKFLLFATDWHRQATARDAEKFLCTRIDYHQQIQAAATRRYNLFTSNYGQQGSIFRLTCSHSELTKDHVLKSPYVRSLEPSREMP